MIGPRKGGFYEKNLFEYTPPYYNHFYVIKSDNCRYLMKVRYLHFQQNVD
jgi:hypothetical protein